MPLNARTGREDMKGLELAEKYYKAFGKAMIEEKFPYLSDRAAVGLVGQGSECLGFDDEMSADHDYGPSFCIWLTRVDYRKYGQALAEEYAKLPSEFEGVKGRKVSSHGGGRVGVFAIPDFYYGLIGLEQAPESNREWMWIPETRLCTAVNGKVFTDCLGEFSAVRSRLAAFYPEDVRVKKIAARAAVMAQSGQYNYGRAIRRCEQVAAQLALGEFIKSTISICYLLNKKYMPFYKWMHHGMKELPVLSEIGDMLTLLVSDKYMPEQRMMIIEAVCNVILQELTAQGLTEGEDNFLESHTAKIMEKIKDPYIRSLQTMEG